MTLPSTVTSREQGNTFIASTGMEISVQTGFAIRTGFYLTNSGNYGVDVTVVAGDNDLAFDFISGVESTISLPAGATRLVPFDFYGLKDVSGPVAGSTGPAGTGAYKAHPLIEVRSQINNQADPEGEIRVDITGYVTGAISRSAVVGSQPDIPPEHPSGFLVLTGSFDDSGKPYNQLEWKNPSTGYYFENYQLQYSVTNTQSASWINLSSASLSFDRQYEINQQSLNDINVSTDIIDSYYYGSPTGLIGNQDYLHDNLSFDTDHYYRIRGVHYDLDQSTVRTTSDWVYGYSVGDLSYDGLNNDILTGLVTGSSTLPDNNSVDPSTILNAKTIKKQAMVTYLKDNESDVNINSKFNQELNNRNLTLQTFTDNFSGYHVVVSDGYTVGSKTEGKAAIETGGQIKNANNSEVKTLLILGKNSLIAGKGGDGGDGGWIKGEFVTGGARHRVRNIIQYVGTAPSTDGSNGEAAIKITDNNITEFKIFADYTTKIYGGGGGGGGGDTTWTSDRVLDYFNNTPINLGQFDITIAEDPTNVVLTKNAGYGRSATTLSLTVLDLIGLSMAGIGGGGQGFVSKGGKNIKRNLNYLEGNGSLEGPGSGTSKNFAQRIGSGGNGGVFGAMGKGQDNEDALFIKENYNRGYRSNAKLPGLAGYAIDAQAANAAAYSLSNFRSNLFYIKRSKANLSMSGIDGFFARWTSDEKAYNSGTTQATNGQTVEKWEAAEYATALNSNVPYLEQTTNNIRPHFVSSGNDVKYFGSGSAICFAGNKLMIFKNVLDADAADTYFRNSMEGFDLFYNIIPVTDGFGFNQFPGNRGHSRGFFNLHSWGLDTNKSYLYNDSIKVVESMGLKENRFSFKDQFWGSGSGFEKPQSSFVYNVCMKKINSNRFIHDVYSGTNLQSSNTIINSNLYFNESDLATLGGDASSFCISDILLFSKHLSTAEREAVNTFLVNKNRVFNLTNVSSITGSNRSEEITKQSNQVPTNTLEMKNGMAGYIVLP